MQKKLGVMVILCTLVLCSVVIQAQTQVAVLEFTGKNVSDEEASALADRLRIELFRTGEFKVMEREIMDQILEEQGFQLSECTSNECIVEMGQLIGVEQVIAGSVSRVGDVFSIAARTVAVATGEIIGIATYDYEGKIGQLLKTGMANVATQLAGEVLPPEPEPVAQQPVSKPEPVIEEKPAPTQQTVTPPPPQPSQAPKPEEKKARIGVTIASSASTLIGEDVPDDVLPKPGFSASVFGLWKLTKGLALRSEIHYSSKGWMEEWDYYFFKANLNYLEFPFLLHLGSTGKPGIGIFATCGASYGILLNSTYTITDDGDEIDSGDLENLNDGDTSVVFGGGLYLGRHLSGEMRFSIGSKELLARHDMKNLTVDLIVGITL